MRCVLSVYRQSQPDAELHDVLDASVDQLLITRLNEQLHEKDMKLTDVRLEALSSVHQLEQLRETLSRMKVKQWHRPDGPKRQAARL